KDKLLKRCQEGFSTVTELADVLVRDYKLSFRQSHLIVQTFVKRLNDTGSNLNDGNEEQIKHIAKELFN
ncbi:hypothetical protein CHH61_26470, partial [Shouchella clausii]